MTTPPRKTKPSFDLPSSGDAADTSWVYKSEEENARSRRRIDAKQPPAEWGRRKKRHDPTHIRGERFMRKLFFPLELLVMMVPAGVARRAR